jgi:hypothetical protein
MLPFSFLQTLLAPYGVRLLPQPTTYAGPCKKIGDAANRLLTPSSRPPPPPFPNTKQPTNQQTAFLCSPSSSPNSSKNTTTTNNNKTPILDTYGLPPLGAADVSKAAAKRRDQLHMDRSGIPPTVNLRGLLSALAWALRDGRVVFNAGGEGMCVCVCGCLFICLCVFGWVGDCCLTIGWTAYNSSPASIVCKHHHPRIFFALTKKNKQRRRRCCTRFSSSASTATCR